MTVQRRQRPGANGQGWRSMGAWLLVGCLAARASVGAPAPNCLKVENSTRIEDFTLNVFPVTVLTNRCSTVLAVNWCRQISRPDQRKILGACADTPGGEARVLSGPSYVPSYILPGQTLQVDRWPMESAYAACAAVTVEGAGAEAGTAAYRPGPDCPRTSTGAFAAWADPVLNRSHWRQDARQPERWTK